MKNDGYASKPSQNQQSSDNSLVLWAFSSKLAFCY